MAKSNWGNFGPEEELATAAPWPNRTSARNAVVARLDTRLMFIKTPWSTTKSSLKLAVICF